MLDAVSGRAALSLSSVWRHVLATDICREYRLATIISFDFGLLLIEAAK